MLDEPRPRRRREWPEARLAPLEERDLHARVGLGRGVDLGFGRIVVSDIEAPIILAIPV